MPKRSGININYNLIKNSLIVNWLDPKNIWHPWIKSKIDIRTYKKLKRSKKSFVFFRLEIYLVFE